MGSPTRWQRETEDLADDFEGDPDDPGRRATLLEGEAQELRDRLDGLLAEIRRHHRSGPDRVATLRRYAPVLIAAVVGATGILAFVRWRGRRSA